jgi:hypothetical protein
MLESRESLVLALVVVLIFVYLTMSSRGRADERALASDWRGAVNWVEGVPPSRGPPLVVASPPMACPAKAPCPTLAELEEQQRAWLNDQNNCRRGVRNDGAGYGSQRTLHPLDHELRTRNGHYLPEGKLACAERQAWAPHNEGTNVEFDPHKGSYAGHDLTQQLGQYQQGDWCEQLSNMAIDPRTQENHRKWAHEVAPHSQGAMVVDNMDEAVVMSQARQGIRDSFAFHTPAQSSRTHQITEVGAKEHGEQATLLHKHF